MSFSAYQFNPEVVKFGGAEVLDNTYNFVGSVAIEPGNLIRINTSGTISLALETGVEAGACHGMLLTTTAGAGGTTPAATVKASILKFDTDTEFDIQLYAAAAADAEPQDVTKGLKYQILRSSSYDSINRSALDVANADGSLLVTAKPGDDNWFDFNGDYDADTDYGIVRCRLAAACLDAFAAA